MAASGRGAMYTMVRYGTFVQRALWIQVCINWLPWYNTHTVYEIFFKCTSNFVRMYVTRVFLLFFLYFFSVCVCVGVGVGVGVCVCVCGGGGGGG